MNHDKLYNEKAMPALRSAMVHQRAGRVAAPTSVG